jgi:L-amino acid N-acyltransferase YncA
MRGRGIGKFLAQQYLYLARDLGYEGSMFNLVYVNNIASVKLWQSLGFRQTGCVPGAGRMNEQRVDAYQFYYDLSTVPPTPYRSNNKQ